jgi:Cu/Ag efflux protein CusF
MKRIFLIGLLLGLFIAGGYAEQKKEHVFKGKVEKIDPNAKTMTVNGEKVEGWMDAMTMVYVPDKEDVLKKVKAGDQITAKVYDGDFRTLHDVQVVAAPAKPAEKKEEKKKK